LLATLSRLRFLPTRQDETAGWSASKLYQRSQGCPADGTWDKAAKYLEKLEVPLPVRPLRPAGTARTGLCLLESRRTGSALAACDRFIKLHPNHPAVDYAYYLKGLINFNEDLGFVGYISSQDPTERDPKAARESFDAFRELATRFPNSKYTPDALLRMNYLVNAMAAQEVNVARYYLKRGAYIAALTAPSLRSRLTRKHPLVEEDVHVLVTAYDKLGMTNCVTMLIASCVRTTLTAAFTRRPGTRKTAWWKLW
jgi:outer membrane protein assembly factor BamD